MTNLMGSLGWLLIKSQRMGHCTLRDRLKFSRERQNRLSRFRKVRKMVSNLPYLEHKVLEKELETGLHQFPEVCNGKNSEKLLENCKWRSGGSNGVLGKSLWLLWEGRTGNEGRTTGSIRRLLQWSKLSPTDDKMEEWNSCGGAGGGTMPALLYKLPSEVFGRGSGGPWTAHTCNLELPGLSTWATLDSGAYTASMETTLEHSVAQPHWGFHPRNMALQALADQRTTLSEPRLSLPQPLFTF